MTTLDEQYRKLEQDFFAYQKMLNEANKDLNKYYLENTKLKELLKKCNDILIAYEMIAKGEYRKKLRELITQINQVLKENT